MAAVAAAQSGGIYQRLRAAFGVPEEGERAVTELSRKNFAAVRQMLASIQPSGSVSRAELAALQGDVAFLSGDMKTAVSDFDKAGTSTGLNDEDDFTLAMALVRIGDDQRARSTLSGLAERYPERSIYIYWLGRLDYDQHRYEEAVKKLSRALALDPKSVRAWDSLGLAFDMSGKMEQARDAFEKAVELNRGLANPSAWPPNDLGFLLLRMNRLPEAEAALREALGYDANLAQAEYHLGRALENEGKQTEAIGEYAKAVNADPASTDACYSLALLYRKLHRDQEAQAMFTEYRKRKQAQPAADSPMSSRATR